RRLRGLWRGGGGRRHCARGRPRQLSLRIRLDARSKPARRPTHGGLALCSRRGRSAVRSVRPSPAEQEHALLAKQIPSPPRRVEAETPPPGIERHRLLHSCAHHVTELAEV